jgi:large repetitive protein
VSGIDASSLPDGTVTIVAWVEDAAGNASSGRTATAPKDTVAPGIPTATYSDLNNASDRITGTAEANATVTATQTARSASGPYMTTASAGGAYTVTVARVDGRMPAPIVVTYVVSATDAAGNTSAPRNLTFSDVK